MTSLISMNRLRWPTVVALLVASAAHIPVIPEHLHEAPYMGMLFIAFTVVAAALAGVLAVRGNASLTFVVAGAVCALAIAMYGLTRLVAFPQLADDVGNWGETEGVISIASEAVVVVLSIVGAARSRRPVSA